MKELKTKGGALIHDPNLNRSHRTVLKGGNLYCGTETIREFQDLYYSSKRTKLEKLMRRIFHVWLYMNSSTIETFK